MLYINILPKTKTKKKNTKKKKKKQTTRNKQTNKNKEVIPYLTKCNMCNWTKNWNKYNGAPITVSL